MVISGAESMLILGKLSELPERIKPVSHYFNRY